MGEINSLIDEKVLLRKLNLTKNDLLLAKTGNPLLRLDKRDPEKFILDVFRILRDPNYLYFTCKNLFDIKLMPYQEVILRELWYRPFPLLIGARGAGKSFLLGLYAILRATLIQGRKVVITGSGFRQAKNVFTYAETIWLRSPILRSIFAGDTASKPYHDTDRWMMRIGESTIVALPLGDGQKIRGERGHDILADEFATIPKDVFETVVSGFGAVELEPEAQVDEHYRLEIMKEMGIWSKAEVDAFKRGRIGNQTIISGTAFYQFNHFYDYWKEWKGIIESKGDPKKISDALNGKEPREDFDWRDYSIIRLPVEKLPPGYMSGKNVARSQATFTVSNFLNEFSACFASDTNGFYKRSLIERCVTNEPIMPIGSNEAVQFSARTRGDRELKYVYGIDPASESDKFSIVILECYPTHRRAVYCWTSNNKLYMERMKLLGTPPEDYYGFCVRKIRDLMKLFPCSLLGMDSQGGGATIREALHDEKKFDKVAGEYPIWELTGDHFLEDGKAKPTDDFAGLHILKMISFSSADWTSEANQGMKQDLEDQRLLFPQNDTALLAAAMEQDAITGRKFDTLEESFMEIEELKEEMATITHTQTPGTLRNKWDTPEIKLPGSKKGRQRKDRYSALLIANYLGRSLMMEPPKVEYTAHGGFVGQIKKDNSRILYTGPDWFVANAGGHTMVSR